MWRRVRLVGAVLLASSLLLPMSTCAAPATDHAPHASREASGHRDYLVERSGGAAWALLFLLPLGVLTAERFLRREPDRRVLWWLQLPLCIAVAIVLYYEAFVSVILLSNAGLGFFAAGLGLACLLVAWVAEGVVRVGRESHET
jgi:hypothetical protein